ncbi:LysR substrate-binding domain-containing protein [Shewanella sp. FJAT-52076]|uniref:LysR substrate-binding domain-containing protein n=1 Tax=Shewanella sp. FJAT-52076 TaxID=2864202 RepID=UPI001C656594|nr:LysR substrate-binding domain-containing protein [Shewanella sp. FJAT-52076]QYJ75968.1 LysR family transcriptional regulator [Shewanella sp. FJAT-52076]
MNIPIKNLHCFVTLAETGSFTRAAEKLHLTQPTLSKMLQRLEDHWQQQLIIRTNQKLSLTQAGELLLEHAREILGQWHLLEEDLSNLRGVQRGYLRLGVCPMMSSLVIELLTAFRARYPGVRLEMFEYGGFGCEKALLANNLDIAFTALPATHADELTAQPLTAYPLLACLPAGHKLANKAALDWCDFGSHPFIMYNQDFALAKLLDSLARNAGVELNVAYRSGQWDFLASMVEANMGLAILPAPICEKLTDKSLCFRPLSGGHTWDLALIWRSHLHLTPAAAAFLALSRDRGRATAHPGAE